VAGIDERFRKMIDERCKGKSDLEMLTCSIHTGKEILTEELGKNEDWFRNLWKSGADEYAFYELAKEIRPDLEFREFDKAWQWRNVLAKNYEQAKDEFVHTLMGWY